MSYTFEYGKQFAIEFDNFPEDQQDAILDFLVTYQEYGLNDFSKYQGKITPSWRGIDKTDPIYDLTYSNSLWHYHIGLPEYQKSKYNNYLTSDMILHFQWKSNSTHIKVLDITWHYKSNGEFWLPSSKNLE